MAFVDDYTAWVIGNNAAENTAKIQDGILPRLKQWEESSGSVFEASKTAFVHYTRSQEPSRTSTNPLRFKEEDIHSSSSAKILGVILDSGLRFRQHLAKATKRAVAAATAVKRMWRLSPPVVRQLVNSVVFPVSDYASLVWYPGRAAKTIASLNMIQRTAAQAIIHGFKTVSLEIAETEAAILSTAERLRRQSLGYLVRIGSLPAGHPAASLPRQLTKRFLSPLQRINQWTSTKGLSVEPILPFAEAPWDPPINVVLQHGVGSAGGINERRAVVELCVKTTSNEGVTHAVISHQGACVTRQIGQSSHWLQPHADLEAIALAADKAPSTIATRIITDNKQAALALMSKSRTDTSYARTRFRELASHKAIEIHYVPRGFTHEGMAKARRDARASKTRRSQDEGQIPQRRYLPLRALSTAIRKEQKERITVTALEKATKVAASLAIPLTTVPAAVANTHRGRRVETGWHTKRIDASHANGHTRDLYNSLTASRAAILAQLRTGICRLNSYLHKINAADSVNCDCAYGLPETVPHFLFSCPRWVVQRAAMREAHGGCWGNVALALGGRPTRIEEKDWTPDRSVVLATVTFAVATGRLAAG